MDFRLKIINIRMKTKKSITGMSMLVALLIGVFVFVVVVFLVPNLLGKGKAEASDNIEATGDFDEDGIANYFDKCKCIAAETDDGCPSGTKVDDPSHNSYLNCPDTMCPSWKPKTESCI